MVRTAILTLGCTLVVLSFAPAAFGSCVPMTPEQQAAQADVIFEGVALEGPTETGIQNFRVKRYLKGFGPAVVRVATGVIRRPDGSGSTTSVSVEAAAGETWRVYGAGTTEDIFRTSECSGSKRLSSSSRNERRPRPVTDDDPPRDEQDALDRVPAAAALMLVGMGAGFVTIARRRRRRR